MIRTLRSCSGRVVGIRSTVRAPITDISRAPIAVAGPFLRRSSRQESLRLLSSAATSRVPQDDFLPPNIQFDRKSSFAPQELSILQPPTPPPASQEDDNDNEIEAKDTDDLLDVAEEEEEEEEIDDATIDRLGATGPQFVIPLPDRLKVDIYHKGDGSVAGTVWLEDALFGADPIRIDLIKQSVDYIRNKIRGRRKAKTKTISEVSGSGRKVKQQKGTGGARAGHSRPAHWRGGAKAHGPKNTTDYGNVKMNKKTKRLAMVSVLSQKLKEGNLIVMDDLELDSHKTGPWSSLLSESFGIGGKDGASALIVDHHVHDQDDDDNAHASFHGVPINLWVASGNVAKVKVVNQRFANVYDILRKEKLVLTLGAIKAMESHWME